MFSSEMHEHTYTRVHHQLNSGTMRALFMLRISLPKAFSNEQESLGER